MGIYPHKSAQPPMSDKTDIRYKPFQSIINYMKSEMSDLCRLGGSP